MPPKNARGAAKSKSSSKDAALKKKVIDKRKGRLSAYPAQSVSELNSRRARLIASQLGIKNPKKYSFPTELVPLIKQQMALIQDCPECEGPCQPDSHVFPEVQPVEEPTVEHEEDDEEDESNPSDESRESVASEGDGRGHLPDDSPSRDLLRDLQSMQNPQDQPVQSAAPAVSFLDHLSGQAGSSSDVPGSPRPGSSTQASSAQVSSAQTDLVVSSSEDDDDDDELDAQIKEVEARHAAELADAQKQADLNKKADAEKRKRKEQRAKAKAAKLEKIRELEKKHQEALSAIRRTSVEDDVFVETSGPARRVPLGVPLGAEKPAKSTRSSRSAKDSAGSDRSRPSNRQVSFDAPSRSPRGGSARPGDDFHPEYRGSSSRSHSIGAEVDMNLLMQLMDRQQKSTEVLASALDKMASSGSRGRVNLSDLSGFDESPRDPAPPKHSSGTLELVQDGKSAMARALGVNPGMKFAFKGDMENIDVSKLRKNMGSGKHRKQSNIVVRQHVWPHEVVSRASFHLWPKTKDFELGHRDQSFAMFQEGMCQKMLIDHESSMPTELQNKLRFQAYLIRLSYVMAWEDILSVSEQFLESFEYNVVEWDNWVEIEKFLDQCSQQARLSSMARSSAVPAALAPPGQIGAGAGKGAPKVDGNVKGVPWKYMKEKGICCGYNAGSCNQKGDHLINNAKVTHICGGCFFTSKGASKEVHRAKTCDKGPWDKNLFQ